jgi:2-oxoglutarate ferredoxin oxidoreductase subunit beta
LSAKNPEYDFKWCPGCGDFGVRKSIEAAVAQRNAATGADMGNNVVIAGIGCSGNMVHLLEGEQPFGFHGIHGRTLPIAMGVKMANPRLNVMIVAGDGDFLSIGMEHIAPQAGRNLNVCAVVMDNGVYGLTKGQSSPTSEQGMVTSSTPFGKLEEEVHPLSLYLTLGVSYVASGLSSKVKDVTKMIVDGMEHPGFAIVHVQSPCTTYNDTYELLKGSVKKGIEPMAWPISKDHDPSSMDAARALVESTGIPLGLVYKDATRAPFEDRIDEMVTRANPKSAEELIGALSI